MDEFEEPGTVAFGIETDNGFLRLLAPKFQAFHDLEMHRLLSCQGASNLLDADLQNATIAYPLIDLGIGRVSDLLRQNNRHQLIKGLDIWLSG